MFLLPAVYLALAGGGRRQLLPTLLWLLLLQLLHVPYSIPPLLL